MASRTVNKITGSGGGAMTDAEVKAAYERNNNTNAFTDAHSTKSSKAVISDASGISGALEVGNTVVLTQAQFDAIPTKDSNTNYKIISV